MAGARDDAASAADPGSSDPVQLEALAIELALGGADIARRGRAASFRVDSKSNETDLVTEVDRRCEAWLVDAVARRRPDDRVLGEEGGEQRPAAGGRVRWVIDPIDGTVNFVLGIPAYAVSIAAELDGVVVAGAVANAANGELFHARAGGGAFLRPPGGTAVRLTGPRDVPLERAVVGTGFGYDPQLRARHVAVVAALLPLIADIRRIGSAALDLCAVAAGRLDGYFEQGLNPWDHAAGGLIAQEAGCVVSGLAGRAPSARMVAVAHARLAPALFGLLEALGAGAD